MKFAVIEYISKTGAIWKHTAERPNYLCDPQTEMDPTSFGCYVSALEGEHIPIKALIHPTIVKRVYRKLLGRWPRYNISYLKNFDVLLIVHQISDGHEVTRLTKRIRQEMPHIKIIGVPTQPYGILKSYWENHPDWLADFREFMDSCHIFATIVESTRDTWQQLTKTPVHYIPQPYPVTYTKQFFLPHKSKKPIIFVAGRTDRDNIAKGLLVAKELQKEFTSFDIHITDIPDPDVNFDTTNLKGARFEFQPFRNWKEHLEYLQYVTLVVNTDYTHTRGRVQADCAAVGTPSIGANSDAQKDMFPELPANENQSIADLVTQGKKLIEEPAFYASVAQTAHTRLQEYSYEKSAKRIHDLIKRL